MGNNGDAHRAVMNLNRKLLSFTQNEEHKFIVPALKFIALLSLDGKIEKDTAYIIGDDKTVSALKEKANSIGLTSRGILSNNAGERIVEFLSSNPELNKMSFGGAGRVGQDILDMVTNEWRERREASVVASR